MGNETRVTMVMLAGAIATVAAWALGQFANLAVPPEIMAAGTTILIALLTWLAPSAFISKVFQGNKAP